MNKKSLSSILRYAAYTVAVVTIIASSVSINANNDIFGSALTKQSCSSGTHVGNHYLANEPTLSKSGNVEFWACCECLEQFTSDPGGTFTNCGAYAGPELADTHIAYVAPIDGFGVQYSLTNCEPASDNPTYILRNGTATFVFNSIGKKIFGPNSVSVTNATRSEYTYDSYSCTVIVTNPVGEVTITVESHSCFVAGTKITMGDETSKNIEDVKVGDVVKSYDVINNEFYVTTVKEVYESSNNTISTITLSDGSTAQCTPNHPICTTDGFKSVDPNFTSGLHEYPSTKLNIGDVVITDHGLFPVVSIETNVGEYVAVYNLSVESNGNELNNTFIANGIVAHNKGG